MQGKKDRFEGRMKEEMARMIGKNGLKNTTKSEKWQGLMKGSMDE